VPEYDNTNRGVLFKNEDKQSDKHPDYKGNINVGGKEFWLSAWIKEGKKGKFMSLSVKAKEDRQQKQQAQTPRSPGGIAEMDEDIPF
jgi:hypothetical protein